MKRKLILWIFLITISFSCTFYNPPDYKSNGVITGPDPRVCPCCGGWFIEIDDQTYNFYELPANSGIDLNTEKFPVNVKLDWTIKESACQQIVISRIAKI